ncbi:MAG: hypothetical protein PHF46_02865 [Candidatus Gracilibacteria bacterium]|nr:hypothetical protein [Candidatus Gracilibacteria bacterium]MDD3120325.1 hypothetical protein [Candidatus Gracilibacteria bacterium]MDD4530613.1 hypothetical protein [Candidatus Gracilibacteria bacterium]
MEKKEIDLTGYLTKEEFDSDVKAFIKEQGEILRHEIILDKLNSKKEGVYV